jgi:YHS domain-containing protein
MRGLNQDIVLRLVESDGRNEMAVDPVCGMQVDEEEAAAGLEYEGETYYFCSRGCMAKFKNDPQAYAKKAEE